MNYKKFKPEVTEQELDDIEKGTEATKSQSADGLEIEESKDSPLSEIRVLMLDGKIRKLDWDLSTTTVKDVINSLFKEEIGENKKISILFAGKVLSENNTLEQWNVKSNFALHAIVKRQNQNAVQSSIPVVQENDSKYPFLAF